jgi:manganese-transporting P-type ATPase
VCWKDLVWRTVDERKVIRVNPSEPLDLSLFDEYDICITGAAMKQFENRPSWKDLVQNTWVYARVSPSQKEYILTSLKTLGYITLMAGDGTNDVGALKQAHIGVALLNGTPEDLEKIAERMKHERIKAVYQSQLKISARFGQPPPPVPPAIAHLLPEAVEAQRAVAEQHQIARQKNPMEKVSFSLLLLSPWFLPDPTFAKSLIWHLSRTSWQIWKVMTKFPKSNLATRLALLLSLRNCPTFQLVSSILHL